jgi:hypothetical protein
MKNSVRFINKLTVSILLVLGLNAVAQPQFTAVKVTDEGAMQLYWQSEPHHLYEIDEADALVDTNTASITWNKLYDDYPSQGTNTFIGDFGNYNLAPQIPHPKNSPMRFYRVVDEGQDSLTDEPTVTIDSLTNNSTATGELTFTVTAATDQPGLRGTILYVDGQEMRPPDNVTNYTIGSTNYETDTYNLNTCEWLNGMHVLYATTEAASQFSSQMNGGAILTGYAVSPFVSILFSNLITGISFSQPSFDPASGQTQQVSAVFAANCDWTLNIVDVYSNVVQTASGSGTSLSYNWDGTADGASLPNGLYYYYITAHTNGQPNEDIAGGGSDGSGGSPPLPDFELMNAPESWVMTANGDDAVPLALYPPGSDTNDLSIFSATPLQINAARKSVSRAASGSALRSRFSPLDSGGGDTYSGPSAQYSPAAPQRPPDNPVRGLAGTFGIATDTYNSNGTNGPSVGPLDNGLHTHLNISMDVDMSTGARPCPPRPEHKTEVSTFVKTMQFYGWSNPLNKIDDQLNINDLRGSGTPFNNVNLGVLMLHGTFGNGPNAIDYAANRCKQMYFAVTSGGSAQYLRFSEMNLGGSGANGLKWMVLDPCYSLYQENWNSMKNAGIKPYNGNLHLLLGATTETFTSSRKWENFANYMNYGTSILAGHYHPLTIREAYYQANQDAFRNAHLSGNVILAVAGDSACMNDSLQTNSSPGGTWTYDSERVYPPQ